MAISIQPVNDFQTVNSAALTPSPDLIAQLAQTNLANSPDTSVIVTLGNGEPATLIYNAKGVLIEVLFDLAPTPAAIAAVAAQAFAATTQTAGQSEVAGAFFNPPANLTQATAANDQLFAIAGMNTEANAENNLTQAAANTTALETTIAQGIAATATNTANPALISLQAANQEQVNALTNTTATNAAFEAELNALETQQTLLAATSNAAGANSITPATPAAATTLNITPASTTQNSIATAAQQALNATSNTTATVQPFNTIPTTATNENLLQDLLTQAANQALTTISSDPSYANSLTALLLSSGTARVRMVDETGTLLNTPEPVGPIRAVVPTRR